MGWEKGRYYTRSFKVSGRVVREYVGCGEIGELACQMDLENRKKRKGQRDEFTAMRDREKILDTQVDEFIELAELLSRGMLAAAGYHQHKLGEWRKRRAEQ